MAPFLLDETAPITFVLNLLGGLVGVLLLVRMLTYVFRTPTPPRTEQPGANAPAAAPQSSGERTLWVVVWLIVAAFLYFIYSLIRGMMS
ncbi:MAG: hypothetical protein EOO61_22620 [Hymenobacter sp.]|nr:MAG: hypothetical protein EOO61_22620 [Hymenobacter sp.]